MLEHEREGNRDSTDGARNLCFGGLVPWGRAGRRASEGLLGFSHLEAGGLDPAPKSDQVISKFPARLMDWVFVQHPAQHGALSGRAARPGHRDAVRVHGRRRACRRGVATRGGARDRGAVLRPAGPGSPAPAGLPGFRGRPSRDDLPTRQGRKLWCRGQWDRCGALARPSAM